MQITEKINTYSSIKKSYRKVTYEAEDSLFHFANVTYKPKMLHLLVSQVIPTSSLM